MKYKCIFTVDDVAMDTFITTKPLEWFKSSYDEMTDDQPNGDEINCFLRCNSPVCFIKNGKQFYEWKCMKMEDDIPNIRDRWYLVINDGKDTFVSSYDDEVIARHHMLKEIMSMYEYGKIKDIIITEPNIDSFSYEDISLKILPGKDVKGTSCY